MANPSNENGDVNQLLLQESTENSNRDSNIRGGLEWIETKKLWHITGAVILTRVATYSMFVITQVFAGQLGEVELAAMSITNNVILGFNFGLILGMASALQTLCGQAFGTKRYHMLGIHTQRSLIVLLLSSFLSLPLYIFVTPLLKLLGQSDDVAVMSGTIALRSIPMHFSFAFIFPLSKFLQSQLKIVVAAWVSLIGLVVDAAASWACVRVFNFGVVGLCVVLDLSWWLMILGLYLYSVCGGSASTWTGWSPGAFSGLWEFFKLSAASGVMISLENWYYRILILMTEFLQNATITVDTLSICMSINGWEMMIPFAFLAAIGVRVAYELGAGNGETAKFATSVSLVQSTIIGLFLFTLNMALNGKFAYMFTSSGDVVEEVDQLSLLLGLTIWLNSVQPILSGRES